MTEQNKNEKIFQFASLAVMTVTVMIYIIRAIRYFMIFR